ncbi:serine hydrolase domain-containing protein [Streptomyces sp. NPDC004752]
MSTRPLPIVAPSAVGVDPRRVHAFLDALETAPDIEPHSLMILRHDRVAAAGWWAPYDAHRPHLLYSLSKSFTSAAAGLAVGEGLLGLDEPVVSYFPEFAADITDPRSRAMLVRHVAAMATGHETETLDRARALDARELVRGFLLVPPDREPGTVFAYNQPATYTLAAIVQRVTGQRLTDYLRPRLFDPLGIGRTAWRQHPPGRDLGFSGMYATTDAIARLGLLHLRGGSWQGGHVLPAAWVEQATRPHISTDDDPTRGPDWRQGYGFQFWMSRHGYRGDGAYGQFCLVLPEHDAVIAMTTATDPLQDVLDLVWEHLLPAFGPAPWDDLVEEDSALAERLAGLALPPLAVKPTPVDPAAWSGARFTPETGHCPQQPTLTAVTVSPAAHGWTLTLTEGDTHLDTHLDLSFDGPHWTLVDGPSAPVPTALSAGWTDDGTLRADIIFLETPHRLALACTLSTSTFTARWRTEPLDPGALRTHQAPTG